MTTEPGISVESALFCDLTRREDSGKKIIVGVYTGEIVVNAFPAALALEAFAIIALDGPVSQSLNFQVIRNGTPLAIRRGTLEAAAAGHIDVSIPVVLDKMTEATTIEFQMQIGDAAWQTIVSRRVIARDEIDKPSGA